MSTRPSLERSVALWMADEAVGGDDDALFHDILAATARARPERRWLALLKEPPMRIHSRVAVGSPTARILLVTLVPLLLLLAGVAAALAVQPSGKTDDWPIFLGDYDRTGVADEGPVGRPVVRWQYHAAGSIIHNIAIVGDLVYAPSDDGLLHALSRQDGTERWTYPAAGSDVSVAEGTLLIADDSGAIHGLHARTGIQRWLSDPLPTPTGATYGDGRFYVGTGAGELVALDRATGEIRWRTTISDSQVHNPSFSDGRVFVGTVGAYVAVDGDDGHLLWTVDLGPDDTGSARVTDGIAFIGKSGDAPSAHLRAIDIESGAELWNKEGLFGAPTIGDGTGYSGGPGRLTAVDLRTGAERWHASFDGGLGGPVLADGVLYVLLDLQPMSYALDAATGGELWRFDVEGGVTGMALAGGVLYEATDTGLLYAIGGDGTTITPGPIPSVPTPAPTPSPTPEPSIPVASGPSPVEFVWSAMAGQDGMAFPGDMALDPDGRLWVADTNNSRFAIFTPDGEFVDFWGTKGSGDGEFDLQRSNGDGYGAIAYAPDGSFYVLDVGSRRVQHFDRSRVFLGAWGGFGLDPGEYSDPVGIAVDAQGVVYVLDDVRDVVETYDADGNVLGSFDAHPDTSSGFNTANSLALDTQGNAYISDCCSAGNQVKKLGPTGSVLATIGSEGTGPGQFSDQPGGMAIDPSGRLFVTQGPTGSGDKVQVFDADGTFMASFGEPGAGDGQLGFATGILLDGLGNLYVADAGGNRVEKYRLLAPLSSVDDSLTTSAAPSPLANAAPITSLLSTTGSDTAP